jgi:hypothetical protein
VGFKVSRCFGLRSLAVIDFVGAATRLCGMAVGDVWVGFDLSITFKI